MSVLLAFDTATEHMSIALRGGSSLSTHEAAGGAAASAALIPAIQALLSKAGLGFGDVDAIGYGRGPGAFTGLRTACSVAQGLALGLGRPVLVLDTLMAVAEDCRLDVPHDDVWVAMDARMQQVYAAHYRHDGERWQTASDAALYDLDALAALWRAAPPRCVAGTALTAFGERLPVGDAVTRPDALPRGRALAALASGAWRAGLLHDAADAQPLYLRDKVALTTVEREAARIAKSLQPAPAA